MKTQLQGIMKIVFLQQEFNGQQDKQNAQTSSKLVELDRKAKLFKAYTKHDGVLSKVDDIERRMQALEDAVQTQQDFVDKSLAELQKQLTSTLGAQQLSVKQLTERVN